MKPDTDIPADVQIYQGRRPRTEPLQVGQVWLERREPTPAPFVTEGGLFRVEVCALPPGGSVDINMLGDDEAVGYGDDDTYLLCRLLTEDEFRRALMRSV